MKRVLLYSALTLLVVAVAPAAFAASPLLTFSVNTVDTTADTLLDHALLVEGHFTASPTPLAAGMYEFDVAIYAMADGGDPIWKSTQVLEVQAGGLLHATIFNVPGAVFFEKEGGLHMVKRYLKLSLPSLGRTFDRVPIESKKNAMAVTRVFQYRLFPQLELQMEPMGTLPAGVKDKILEFIANKQTDEVVNTLVKKFVEQSLLIDELQNRIDKLEASKK